MQYISLNMTATRKILKKFVRRLEGGLPADAVDAQWILEVIVHPEQGDLLHTPSFLPAQAAHELHDMLTHTPLKTLAATLSQWDADLLALRKRVWDSLITSSSYSPAPVLYAGTLPQACPLASPPPPVSLASSVPPPINPLPVANQSSTTHTHTHTHARRKSHKKGFPHARTQSFQQSMAEQAMHRLRASQTSVEQEARLVRARPAWSAPIAAVFEEPPTEELEAVLHKHKSRIMTGLIINLVNSMLYMANYNLIVPTVEAFCQHIGVSANWAGIIVGLADTASIVFSCFYSLWTRWSFVTPIVASSVASVLGNVLYCVSYDAGGLGLLLASRFLTGMGSARMVTRRFIADYMTGAQSTRACIAFVSSSAVGMALGPLLTLPLSYFPWLSFLGLSFNPLTMPGWLMAGAWLIQLNLTLMLFREPPIEEVRAVQAAQANSSTKASTSSSSSRSNSPKPKPDGTQSHWSDLETPLLVTEQDSQPIIMLPISNQSAKSALSSKDQDVSIPLSSSPARSTTSSSASPSAPRAHSVMYTLPATVVCLLLLCVLKTVQQGHTDLVPAFTRPIGFDEGSAGLFLAGCGLAMLPVSLGVGMLATRVSDRALTLAATVLTVLCCGVLCRSATHHAVYLSVSVVIFLATAVLESAAMALTSKIMHPSLAHGFFNAGLITTQAGSIGRLGGNLLVSEATRYAAGSTARLALALYSASGAATALCLALLGATYRRMRA